MNKREHDAMAWGLAADAKMKKKRSRWANDDSKTFIPGMPTVIPHGLSKDQEEQYMVHLQIEEISRRLRTGDLGIPLNPEERSPSPEPIYNSEGKRLNTREYRTRKKLEEDRHRFITRAFELNTEYKPPADYKPPIIRVHDKVMIPQEEHPDINFVGLLIGPRGNTLKNLEKDTGAKIIIRGKGSVKEGKIGRKDGQPLPGEDEPLHAYVTANNPENVKKAVDKKKEKSKQGIEVPEGQNDLRRQQLRELALLNGTLRENDGLSKLKQLQQAQSIITNTIICTVCGGTGHIAQDCKQKRPGDTLRATLQQQHTPSPVDKAKMDSEYMSLMAELGEGPPPKPTHSYNNPRFSHHHHSGMVNQHSGWTPNSNPPPIHQHQPKPMLSLPPPTNMTSQPHHLGAAPPGGMAVSSQANMLPPWQQHTQPQVSSQVSAVPTTSINMGVPPPNVLSAPPPPPPPNSQPQLTSGYPWQHAPQQHPQGAMPVPPPPSAVAPPPWQSSPVPPPPPNNMPPWQQGPPPTSAPMPPPPPPPTGYTSMAPPPPPPDMASLAQSGMHGIPLGVPPPPPPN